ncbi:MAG: hypothetical protein RLZZ200_2887 [Pseudomonadota bacterium]|jgi:cytoskeleton protein RodZ
MKEDLTFPQGPSGLGELLKSAREKCGTTLADAAGKLRVDVSVLEALEDERFLDLGAPVYVRGHLRRYAELLGEAPDTLQALYSGHASAAVQPDLARAARIIEGRPARVRGSRVRRRRGRRLALVAGLVVVAAILWWGFFAQATP